MSASGKKEAFGRRLVLILGGVVALLMAGAFLFFRMETHRIQQDKYSEIETIARLKVGDLVQWRKERLGDVLVLSRVPLVRKVMTDPQGRRGNTDQWRDLHQWLSLVQRVHGYPQILLAGVQAEVVISVPDVMDIPVPVIRKEIQDALSSPGPVMGEIYRLDSGDLYLDVACAVRSESGQPIGVVLVSIHAGDYVIPLITDWPTPSASAESLLVRRVGDEIEYLNELRHQTNTALLLRMPLSRADLPAVQAALGQTGFCVGKDYRGVDVLADLRSVPDTDWFMVTKVDTAEILKEVHTRAALILAILSALTILAVGITAYVYRTHQVQERIQAEAGLRAAKDYAENLIATANAMVIGLDRSGNVVVFNKAAEEITGYRMEELQNRNWFEVLVPRDRYPQVWDVFEKLAAGELPRNFENPVLTKSGDERYIAWQNNQVVDNGSIVGSISFGLDITERRRMEELLRRQNEELLRFTYAVSHDLKSPVVTILSFLGYLEKDIQAADPARIADDLGYIRRAAEKMSLLLNEVLELSRIGHKANPAEDVTLRVLVGEALDLVAGRMTKGGVKVQVSAQPVILHGDRPRLLEVFQNLLDNAAKFMGNQPAPRVEVGVEESGAEPVIFVRDNGMGIDPRHQNKLFRLFEKLQPEMEGAGMGLIMIKRIIESHGGRIWAESEGLGKGTTFLFTLAQTRLGRPPETTASGENQSKP